MENAPGPNDFENVDDFEKAIVAFANDGKNGAEREAVRKLIYRAYFESAKHNSDEVQSAVEQLAVCQRDNREFRQTIEKLEKEIDAKNDSPSQH